MGSDRSYRRRLVATNPNPSSVAGAALCRQPPKVGARCVNRARRDLCGGRPKTNSQRVVPTAIASGGDSAQGPEATSRWTINIDCSRARAFYRQPDAGGSGPPRYGAATGEAIASMMLEPTRRSTPPRPYFATYR
jgi:hypothetical protein